MLLSRFKLISLGHSPLEWDSSAYTAVSVRILFEGCDLLGPN